MGLAAFTQVEVATSTCTSVCNNNMESFQVPELLSADDRSTIFRMPNLIGLARIVIELRSERTNLSNQLRHVDAALSVLGKLDGKLEISSVNGWPRKGTRLSAAARRKISIAQKARWAKMRGASTERGQMSAAARRKISLAQNARWAKVKAGKK